MNERNVAALAELLCGTNGTISWAETCERYHDSHPAKKHWLDLAAKLAARGVLVPAALTDEEARQSPPFDGEYMSLSDEECRAAADRHRAALERIAKGEPA